ncbi:MAG: NBR1-Ig-like domain-containing protein [Chloroflexota bacterium]
MKRKLIFIVLTGMTLLLAACGSATTPEPTPDVAAVRTSAASTVVSQFTLTAAVFTPVPPPLPTNTTAPEPTTTATEPPVAEVTNAQGTTIALCDKYAWDVNTVDVNIPDNTVMTPGQDFTKTWLIKNIGNCAWGEGYKLIFSYGEKMSGEAQPFTAAIAPGEEVQVSVNFKAPALAGTYFSFWTLQNAKGVPFLGNDDKAMYVQIIVQ